MLVKFFRKYDIVVIRHKLVVLYLLNLADILLTELLLNTGYYMEANFLMRNVVDNLFGVILTKFILPFLLLLIIYVRIEKATERQLHISNIIINLTVLLYVLINISHIIWTVMYIFML